MPDIIVYLLKANLAIILFYFGYRVLLRKLTFYNLNRCYLLFALLFSASYPLIDVDTLLAAREEIPEQMGFLLVNWQQVPEETVSLWPAVTAVIWIGMAWCAARLLIRLGSLWRIHRGSRPAVWRRFHYRQIFGRALPFSFWRNIYLNVHNHTEHELGEIFEHEQIHVAELHTADVLLAELCSICCWFNPGVWLIRHAIHENLEFITDRRVLQSGVDKKTYQYSLLKVVGQARRNPALASYFNLKSLKRRIMMMNKKQSSSMHLGKYLLAIPVIAVSVFVMTVTQANQEEAVGAEAVRRSADTTKQAEIHLRNLGDEKPPLLIVDGERYSGTVQDLDPNQIERISVLKDATAAARYGKAGTNGVIEITTKTGAGDKLKVVITEGKPSRSSDIVQQTVTLRDVGHVQDTAIRITGYRTSDKPVTIRHINSSDYFNGALIVIDGKESDPAALKQLNPNDIEAINVLKDKPAIDKYGTKGSKGALEITTKK